MKSTLLSWTKDDGISPVNSLKLRSLHWKKHEHNKYTKHKLIALNYFNADIRKYFHAYTSTTSKSEDAYHCFGLY